MHDVNGGAHHHAGDGDLREFLYDGLGAVDDASPHPDQFELQVGNRPACQYLVQIDAENEGGQVVRKPEQGLAVDVWPGAQLFG